MRTSFLFRAWPWVCILGGPAAIGCSAGVPSTLPLGTDGGGRGGNGGGDAESSDVGVRDTGTDGGEEGGSVPDEDSGIPQGGGVGASCSASMPCRVGLSCGADGACVLGGTLPPGSACVVNGECAEGGICAWQGSARVCVAGGLGASGTSCRTDADCGAGLRCAIVGLGAQCRAEGRGDVGGACKIGGDCLGGLSCLGGRCSAGLPGTPPFGLPSWPGETCEPDTGAPISYFRVPRGADDKDFYRLPFPNDLRRRSGRIDLHGHPSPGGSEVLGFDLVDRYLRAIEADNDGFGAYSTVYFRFNVPFDLTHDVGKFSIDYVDVTAGPSFGGSALNGLHWYRDFGRSKYICPNYLAVRMVEGQTLQAGHTYAVILRDIDMVPNGGPVKQAGDLTALLGASPPGDPPLAAAYPVYQPVRDYLAMKSIAADAVVNATVFTVAQPQREIARITDVEASLLAPVPTGWVKCGASPSPCPDATGERACDPAPDPAFDELHALVPLPIFQSGTPPYETPAQGGRIDTAAPVVVRTENVCLSLTVPKGAPMPEAGWALVLYAHGTGGSFRSHVREGVARALATVDADNPVPMAVLGIDQVAHGPRRGGSSESPSDIFFNFSNPYAARDNAVQGAADQIALVKLAVALDLRDTSLTGSVVKIDPAALLFWGHSQGATAGGIAAPYLPALGGVVFSGQGASLLDSLLTKTNPTNTTVGLAYALGDVEPGTPSGLRGEKFHPALSILQMYLDPSDPLHYAARLTPPTAGGHHVLQVYGQGDSYSTPITQLTYALAAQLGVAPRDPGAATADYPELLREAGGALTKNVGGRLTAVVRQYARPEGFDGHFVAYRNTLAQRDIRRFLGDLAKGIAPTVAP